MQPTPRFAVLEGTSLHRSRWLLVAGNPQEISCHRDGVRGLVEAGHTVELIHFDRLPAPLDVPVAPRRISAVTDVPKRVRRVAKAIELAVPPTRRAKLALAADASLAQTVRQAEYVLLLDDAAAGAQGPLRDLNPTARYWTGDQVDAVLQEELWWRYLDRRLHQLSGSLLKPLRTKGLMEAVTWLEQREPALFPPPADLHRFSRSIIHGFVSTGRLERAAALLRLCRRAESTVPPGDEAPAFTALEMHLRLHDEVVPTRELEGPTRAVFASADAALESLSWRDCAGRMSIAIDLLFHPRLHTDVPSTPLVDDPTAFTAPLRESRVGRLLTAPAANPHAATATAAAGHRVPDRSRLKVVYLPGSYPWHAARALSALRHDPRVDLSVLRLRQTTLQSMSIGEYFVTYLLGRAVPGAPEGPRPGDQDQLSALEQADVVVADWADKGAVWASRELPTDARLVVRVHSADVLSAGVHLVDWSRVDDVICVSEHLRHVFVALLGDRVAHLRIHVIPNLLADLPAEVDEPGGADGRTLAMVGWGQKVKDPLMALEILAALLRREPGWRLRLIGADFPATDSGLVSAYVEAFRRRAAQPDLVDAIDYTGHTADVPAALAGSSFILSTSLRESFHIGAMEGIVAGAVPVIRDWPAFARYHGAAGLFPPSAIFETVDEAVDIIWSLRDPAARHDTLRRAQESMRSLLDGRSAAGQLLEVILG
ncbi:glycosyltransferase family 4 protein [Intrasporangium sp. DVR]|uniref:glycosyltransferase family 4 protein n=1 Tax=Intrasporangium sp. DVR TaxID=3127867 RepID=UPI00313A558A